MTFWKFLDNNSEGLGFLIFIGFLFAFGTCGDGHGCRLRMGCGSVETGPPQDAGAEAPGDPKERR